MSNKQLLQQALDALESASPFINTDTTACKGDKCRESWCSSCNTENEAEIAAQAGYASFVEAGKAIVALRAAIAQPESEPVAWFNAKRDMTYLSNHYADDIPLYVAPVQTVEDDDADLLTIAYMAGAASKKPAYVPLSDEQVKQIVIDACDQQFGTGGDTKFTDKDAEFYGIAFRAIEKAVRGEIGVKKNTLKCQGTSGVFGLSGVVTVCNVEVDDETQMP